MRRDKIWTVARKDLSEFKTNKYIMFTLILMPLLIAVVMPLVYILPFTMFSDTTTGEPLSLDIMVNETRTGVEVINETLRDMKFENLNITNAVIIGSLVENCLLNNVVIRDSIIGNSTAVSSVLVHSNLYNVTIVSTLLQESVRVGEVSETEEMLSLFIDSLLMMFVMIPAIIPTIIASYSFVGEKLNRSLEPLLATPTTDGELLLGKSLSIFLPTMGVTWLSLIPFIVLVDIIVEPVIGYYPLPNAIWILGAFLLAPLICLLGIFANVIISSKVSDVRASQQIGSLIVLPVVIVFIITIAGLITLSILNMVLFILLMLALDAAVLYACLKVFAREEILVRWK